MSQPTQGRQSGGGLGAGAITSLVGVAVLAVFALQNRQSVDVQFLWIAFTWPLWLYTIVVAVFGALVWLGFGIMRRHRRRAARRDERRS